MAMIKIEQTAVTDRDKYQLMRSIARLKMHSEFEDLVAALRQSLQVIDQKNRTADAPVLHRGQGAAQFVASLLETIEQSDDISRAIESRMRKNA